MTFVEEFLDRYRKEYDYYDRAGQLASQAAQAALEQAGVRSIVTHRAKSISRLRDKCVQRDEGKNYQSVQHIYDDIVDLAGVRIALYFPGDRSVVDGVVNRIFNVLEPRKDFPESSPPKEGKRFSGYSATHYRVSLNESHLSEMDKRFASARIEIQVASVLMHSWSEVEHDLIYKPLSGSLSPTEYALLDQVNGLVLSGEIALEQLQRAGQDRIRLQRGRFRSHYDLAAYLIEHAKALNVSWLTTRGLGQVDTLYLLLQKLRKRSANSLQPYLKSLETNFEKWPLADQVIESLLSENPTRYSELDEAKAELRARFADDAEGRREAYATVGKFLARWSELERRINESIGEANWHTPFATKLRDAVKRGLIPDQFAGEIDSLRRLRNSVVHNAEPPNLDSVADATAILDAILEELRPNDS